MKLFLLVIPILLLFSCQEKATINNNKFSPKEYVQLQHPEWTKNATIYEVNIRQYTPEGTFAAFAKHLPRIKEMGIDIIWLMPIHPIGIEKRKGTLGSEYSVKDYYGINPEYGSKEDFKALISTIHSMGMHIIIDWVGNHSSWDNQIAKEHPDWYTKSIDGKFQPTPWYDWDDVIDFDYNVPALRDYMTKAMQYWIKEYDIDGYRCDVAGFIPVDFWEQVRGDLETIKPVFMLAEWESRDLYKKSFDMTYAWSLWNEMKAVCTGGRPVWILNEYLAHDVNTVPRNAYRMTFTENHDKNSWEGNQFSNFGKGLETAMVFACTVNGMPLVYSGQEAGLDRSLPFFEKDSIEWKEHNYYSMYKELFALKHSNQALWNGNHGAEMLKLNNSHPKNIISFARIKNKQAVLTITNFSNETISASIDTKHFKGSYKNLFSKTQQDVKDSINVTLKPWGYVVLHK